MKNILRYLTIIAFIIFIAPNVFSQGAPPPPPADHGSSGNQTESGGGAPIGGGLFILLGLGAAYGGKKIYDLRNNLEE